MNKSLPKAIAELEKEKHVFAPFRWQAAHNFGMEVELPEKPLRVRSSTNKTRVCLAARYNFVYYLAEIFRHEKGRSSTYLTITPTILKAAWCLENCINFATSKLSPEEAHHLYQAYNAWLSLRYFASVVFLTDKKKTTDTVKYTTAPCNFRPKWLDGAYLVESTVTCIKNNPDYARNQFRGMSPSCMFYVGSEQPNTRLVLNNLKAVMSSVCEWATREEDRWPGFGFFIVSPDAEKLAEEYFRVNIPFQGKLINDEAPKMLCYQTEGIVII